MRKQEKILVRLICDVLQIDPRDPCDPWEGISGRTSEDVRISVSKLRKIHKALQEATKNLT